MQLVETSGEHVTGSIQRTFEWENTVQQKAHLIAQEYKIFALIPWP